MAPLMRAVDADEACTHAVPSLAHSIETAPRDAASELHEPKADRTSKVRSLRSDQGKAFAMSSHTSSGLALALTLETTPAGS